MKRNTIDYGIDLGTTNSAIAVLDGVQTEIIKNNDDLDLTASAVYYDKRCEPQTGEIAKRRSLDPRHSNDVYLEYKRRMGSDHLFRFAKSGVEKKPEELSALLLQSLKRDVIQRKEEDISAAAITVPAAFQLNQCDATQKSAKLAGFEQCVLLQEPVAASLAYGFQADEDKAFWLVFDFGGGTFDAAVIKAEDGLINVVNHGGDNYLGGADLDWAIVEKLIVPRLLKEYSLDGFNRGNKSWNNAFINLKWNAENARKELSRSEKTYCQDIRFEDEDGEEIEFECDLTRDEVANVCEPVILKSIKLAKSVLTEKNLSDSDLSKIILVGGPTLSPFFREMLTANFPTQIDFSLDPMTVVARGAAIFAGTQQMKTSGKSKPIEKGTFAVDLKYKPIGQDVDPMIGGKLKGNVSDFTGYTLEFLNKKTQWRSGVITLRSDGAFMAQMLAEKGVSNIFMLELKDPNGVPQIVEPDSFTYTVGAAVEEQPVTNTMSLALANNDTLECFPKGTGLPAKKVLTDLVTAHDLKKGQSGAMLKVPVVEGEHGRADRNKLSGLMEVPANNISRDLNRGSEIEVTLILDESRKITIKVYVPLLDQEFESEIDLSNKEGRSGSEIQNDCKAELQRFKQIKKKASETGDAEASGVISDISDNNVTSDLEGEMKAAGNDVSAAQKAENMLIQLRVDLDKAEDSLEWPTLVQNAREEIDKVEKLVDEVDDDDARDKFESLKDDIDDLIENKKADRLRKKLEKLTELNFELLREQPDFWVSLFRFAEKQSGEMQDQERADVLLNQGREFIQTGNLSGLKNVVAQLIKMLPERVQEQAQAQGYGSGIARN